MAEKYLAWHSQSKLVSRPNVNFSGRWRNDLGSEMRLVVKRNRVTGTYRTAVGAPSAIEAFKITGEVNGDLIAFIVNWNRYGSITAWVGQHTTEKGGRNERIATFWHLNRNIDESEESKGLWSAVLTGFNTFKRVRPKGKKGS